MRMLVLGGTSFVGRHIVAAALDAGHEVTLFNRGRTNPGLFDGVEERHGDRAVGDYASLAQGSWDAVVDVNAYVPRAVRQAVAAIGGRAGHYTFVSTCSVYPLGGDGPIDESHPLATLDEPETEVVDPETYGGLKVLCEQAAAEGFPGRCTIIRPGIVAGPFDPTGRFTYWVRRAAVGGTVLAPDRPDQPVQVVHARDLGDFTVDATARGLDGPFNLVGPTEPLTLAGVLQACAAAAGRDDVEVEWVAEQFLHERDAHFPLHLPSAMGADGLFRCSAAKALAEGFSNRPIAQTAADTLAWDDEAGRPPIEGPPDAGREVALLREWRATGSGT